VAYLASVSYSSYNFPDVVMNDQKVRDDPSLLDVVALLNAIPAERLARGQVGTVVEQLDGHTVLVEFSDDQGRAYVIVPCERAQLLVLHYEPQAA
jgi:hypothetical protein